MHDLRRVRSLELITMKRNGTLKGKSKNRGFGFTQVNPSFVLLKIGGAASVALQCIFCLSKKKTEISEEAVLPLDGV